MAITQTHIDKAIELAKQFGATKLLIFGSAYSDPKNANDLDLAVEGIDNSKFFDYAGLLEYMLNISVDVVDLSDDISFINHIKKNGRYIYVRT